MQTPCSDYGGGRCDLCQTYPDNVYHGVYYDIYQNIYHNFNVCHDHRHDASTNASANTFVWWRHWNVLP